MGGAAQSLRGAAIPTILWLEDSSKDRRLIREALREIPGAPDVEFADDGQAFLDRLAELKPALAVLDLRMPGLDGMDILEHMHGHPIVARLPIVVFSTGEPPEKLASLEHPRIREYVRKPDAFAEFPAAVSRVLRHAASSSA